jgi:hypothetical protein
MPVPPSPLPAEAAGHALAFDPAADGFAFPNVFTWTEEDLTDLADQLRAGAVAALTTVAGVAAGVGGGRRALAPGAVAGGLLGAAFGGAVVRGLARGWPTFGLCGGMALSAIERWPHRAGLRTGALERDRVRALLRRRQARTIRAAGARFVGYWLGTRLLGGAALAPPFGEALRREVAAAQARIDAGRPVVLGLVGDAPDPFEMHQVVAFGYRDVAGGTRFDVYDPNAPGKTRHVTAGTDGARTHVTTDLPTGPRPGGRVHLSTKPGRLGMAFVVC